MATDYETINNNMMDLLSNFGSVDIEKLAKDAKNIDSRLILDSGVLTDKDQRVKIDLIAIMEALLATSMNQKLHIKIPNDVSTVKDALILFLQLNQTDEFRWRDDDSPSSWAFRTLDHLFLSFSRRSLFDQRDYLVLSRIADLPHWEKAFATSMELYLKSHASAAVIAALDMAPVKRAVASVNAAMEQRHRTLPSTRYGSGGGGEQTLTQYAIGLYFGGANINEAMRETLVVQTENEDEVDESQLDGILKENSLQPGQFPVTIEELKEIIAKEVTYRPTEQEAIAICCKFAERTNRMEETATLFAEFTDAVFPVTIKTNQLFNFGKLKPQDSARLVARWMRKSEALDEVRKSNMDEQTKSVVQIFGAEERKALLRFRSGRNNSDMLSKKNVERYVTARLKQVHLDAEICKVRRVQRLLDRQMKNAQRFMMMPGKDILKGLTYGIESFFRSFNSIFTSIFDDISQTQRIQMRELTEINEQIGPISALAILTPRTADLTIGVWSAQARKHLEKAPLSVFE